MEIIKLESNMDHLIFVNLHLINTEWIIHQKQIIILIIIGCKFYDETLNLAYL